MKIHHLAIIFVLIIVPISLVLSQYMQSHISTIENQTQYSTRLINATYDGIKAFQINTSRNEYSTLTNSKIRDINASINTFYTTLGTSMGSSGYKASDLQSYTPALVMTLYDGYYIYTSYKDGDTYTYGLLPSVSYTCRYAHGNNDFIVNYTLDNRITIIGRVKGEYFTKSGYLISVPESLSGFSDASNEGDLEAAIRKEYKIEREKLTENLIILNSSGQIANQDSNGNPLTEKFEYIIYNGQKVYKNNGNVLPYNQKYFYYSSGYQKNYVTTAADIETYDTYFSNSDSSDSAIQYYKNAIIFSNWVNDNLSDVNQSWAKEADGLTTITSFATKLEDENKIFATNSSDNDPLTSYSYFDEHRMNVIRYSITTNLIVAIANYTSSTAYDFAMPNISETDWYKIENNICMVSFLQGMPIGSKVYNNYCVISNNTNKETVGADSIYIITENNNTGEQEYHKPGCKTMVQGLHDGTLRIIGAYSSSDFIRKSVSLTGSDANASDNLTGANEGSTAYYYPQSYTSCYDCIVEISTTYNTDDIVKGSIVDEGTTYNFKNLNGQNLQQWYLQALARCRYDLYTVNGYFGE